MNTVGSDYATAIKSFENANIPVCDKDPWRLKFHVMPPVGWLNDPNGLAYFNHAYHVYFQYSPFNAEGGMKCWGHYTSVDLVTWTYEGAVLFPDEAFDVHGVYSGSALTEDDYMYLYYTGNVKKNGNYDYINEGREANTVCVRTIDGNNFEEKVLVMKNQDYGDDLTCHVRDPKVWEENQHYYMVQGARDRSGKGKVLLFESPDKWNWTYKDVLEREEVFGYMWECPDLFQLDGQWILCFSPQGLEEQGEEFKNIYQSGFCLVNGNPLEQCGSETLGTFKELDRGFDYYAPQSFLAPDGRRLQIGWMGLPDIQDLYENPTVKNGWQHAMTVPRELTFKNGKLLQNPVKELKTLRGRGEELYIAGTHTADTDGCFEMELQFYRSDEKFYMKLDQGLIMEYDQTQKRFEMSFTSHIGAGRTKRSVFINGLLNLRLLVDTSSVELFLNNGEEVFTTRFYPEGAGHELIVSSQNASGALWNYDVFR